MIVIIHGPQGCGKSMYARSLASYFGMDRIHDGWSATQGMPPEGTLVLTNDKKSAKQAARHRVGVVCLSFDQEICLATRPRALLPT